MYHLGHHARVPRDKKRPLIKYFQSGFRLTVSNGQTVTMEFVHLRSPLGITYNIQLTKEDIDRINTDDDYFVEVCKKYDELYKNGFVGAVTSDEDHIMKPLMGYMEIKPEHEQYLIPLIEARPSLWDFRIPTIKTEGKGYDTLSLGRYY